MTWLRRPLRIVGMVVGSWVGLFVLVNVTILLAGAVSRWTEHDPRLHGEGDWPPITHLRMVDDKLLVGGQTSIEDYRGLAERGVVRVIDVRSSGAGETGRDDPEELAKIGLEYVALPIPDGRAPTPSQIRRFLALVDETDGLVFAHCGGGVGRSTSLAAAYEASQGQDPSVLEQVATGPPTIEQIWFVGTLQPNHPEHGISPAVAILSRIVDSPRSVFGYVTSLF